MPTKLKRFPISVPDDLLEFLTKDAEMHTRPLATHVIHICKQYYWEMRKNATVITQPALGESEGQRPPPHYGKPRLRGPQPLSEVDDVRDQGKNA